MQQTNPAIHVLFIFIRQSNGGVTGRYSEERNKTTWVNQLSWVAGYETQQCETDVWNIARRLCREEMTVTGVDL